MIENAPTIALLNELLKKALSKMVSDIHLEPTSSGLRVRFRVDGILYEEDKYSKVYQLQIVSRIKVLAQMNVSEKRVPQDGKFCFQDNQKNIDLRVSTFPSAYGEKVVIRILDHEKHGLTLDSLGLNEKILAKIKALTQSSSGFFLSTGPTGSGKTTTLHAMLNLINNSEKNIVTLEDPVEYHVEGITQGQIYPDISFTFEKGIRAILRQDPDVIMVGEIRDKETAQVAIQAALTGHFVLSTLHTNDASSTLMRLLDMGIEPFLINATLTGILTQRLARKLCVLCREQVKINPDEKTFIENHNLPITNLFNSKGCVSCHDSGYKGRIGIFEFISVTHDLRNLITSKPIYKDIFDVACKDGMVPLIYDAVDKVNSGIISLYELARITC